MHKCVEMIKVFLASQTKLTNKLRGKEETVELKRKKKLLSTKDVINLTSYAFFT